MITGDSSDDELLAGAVGGSQLAFQLIYRRHHSAVYRFARAMCSSSAVADEITQEVFFILIRQLDRFDPGRGPLRSYLLGIARNHTLSTLRRERLYVEFDETEPCAAATEPERSYDLERLRQAIGTLPPVYREVVLLCEIEELDYAEAAKVIGCPIGTVRSRLHRARALLLEKCRAEKARARV